MRNLEINTEHLVFEVEGDNADESKRCETTV